MRRWLDWLMNDQVPLYRLRAQSRAMNVRYEKAGLTLHHPVVPWCADAVLVEVSLRLSSNTGQRNDFQLRIPGREPINPEEITPLGEGDRQRVFFRLPVPSESTTAELTWRNRRLGGVDIPVISRSAYLAELRLDCPTVFVRVGAHTLAAKAFVSSQCKGLHASAVLRNPHGLAPLTDLNLMIRLRSDSSDVLEEAPALLTSEQLAAKEALISVVPGAFPRRMGTYSVEWVLEGEVVAARKLHAMSQNAFLKSLTVLDTRFVSHRGDEVVLDRHAPKLGAIDRVGPCFVIGSREPGLVGVCQLQIAVQVPGGVNEPILAEEEVLLTEGPTPFAPGTVDASEARQIIAFVLRGRGGTIGTLALSPIPEAHFNGEGGYKAPAHFNWSAMAEAELKSRLDGLLDG